MARLKGPWVTRLVEKLQDTIKDKNIEIERLKELLLAVELCSVDNRTDDCIDRLSKVHEMIMAYRKEKE